MMDVLFGCPNHFPPLFQLLQIVLPSKSIRNEKILETLMVQANSGMYRVQDSYLEACQNVARQKMANLGHSEDWESFDLG